METNSEIILVVLSLIAALTPSITVWLNNRHQLKIKELELKERILMNDILYKRKIVKKYLVYVGLFLDNSADNNISHKYHEYYSLMYSIIPKEYIPVLEDIHHFAVSRDRLNTYSALEELAPVLSNLTALQLQLPL